MHLCAEFGPVRLERKTRRMAAVRKKLERVLSAAAQRMPPSQLGDAASSGSAGLAPWGGRRYKQRGRAPMGQRADIKLEDLGVHVSHIYDNIEGPSHFLFWASACQPAPHDVLGIDVSLLNFDHGLALSEWTYRRYIVPKLFRGVAARHPMWAKANSSIATLTRRAVAVARPEYGILLREKARPAGQPFPVLAVWSADPQCHRASTLLCPISASPQRPREER